MNGRAFLVENYDPISALSHLRHRDLTPRAWLASLRAVDETAWFARDDLRPFGLMCLRMGWRLASRPFGASGGHAAPVRIRYRAGRAAAGRAPGRARKRRARKRRFQQKEEMPL